MMRLPDGVKALGRPDALSLRCEVSTPDALMGLFLLARELQLGLCHVSAGAITRAQIRYSYAGNYPMAGEIEAWLAPTRLPSPQVQSRDAQALALVLTADATLELWGQFGLDGPPLPSGRAGQRIARAFEIAHAQLPCAFFYIDALRPVSGPPHLAELLLGSAGRLAVVLRLHSNVRPHPEGTNTAPAAAPAVAMSNLKGAPMGEPPSVSSGECNRSKLATLEAGDQALIQCFDPESCFQP